MAKWENNCKAGDVFSNKAGHQYEVLEIISTLNVTIRFLRTGTIIEELQKSAVVGGRVMDHMEPSVYGIGYLGERTRGREPRQKAHRHWNKMFTRCYCEKYHRTRPTYIGCSVCEEWHNYTVFRDWFDENYIEGYVLDKDLLVPANKTYSPDTCCFLPPELNILLAVVGRWKNGCAPGVTRCTKKGTKEPNGIYRIDLQRAYLGRFTDLDKANSIAIEYKQFYVEELADKYLTDGKITKHQHDCLIAFDWVNMESKYEK